MRYTHVVFDIDGTLIESGAAIEEGLQLLCERRLGHRLDDDTLALCLGLPAREALEAIGLPYRSDDLVTIHSEFDDAPFRDNYFADFKIPNFCGGITIHEHLGALHLKDYPDNSLKRLNDYHNFSIYELPDRPVKHSEITWSFEPDIRDPKLLRSVIRRILLPSLSEY